MDKDPSTSSVLLDGRTGAVMANTTPSHHQEEIKHKVQAVREVVPSRSNNDIHLVLQYYDYDLERATAAFLEDGAKEALDQWKFSGNKPVSKKKKKTKTKGKDVTTLTTTSTTITTATSTSSGQYASTTATTTMGNGPYMVSDSQPTFPPSVQLFTNAQDHSITDRTYNHDLKLSITSDIASRSNGYHHNGDLSNGVDITASEFTMYKGIHLDTNGIGGHHDESNDHALSISSAASTLSSLSTSLESSPTNNHIPTTVGKPDLQPRSITAGKPDLQPPHSIVNNHVIVNHSQSAKQQQKKSRSRSRDKVAMSTDKASTTDKVTGTNKSRGFGSPAMGRKAEGMKLKVGKAADEGKNKQTTKVQVKSNVNEQQSRSHTFEQTKSHSYDHTHQQTARPKTLEGHKYRKGKTRERTISEVSMSSVTTTSTITGGDDTKVHKDHRGLEKSLKDLQRQMTSLHRHRNILSEDCEKSQKQIAKVFALLGDVLMEREAQLMLKMDHLKTQATDTLSSRQQQGLALKARADKAFKMADHELVELRQDIKHFVSDRKVDEDIATQKKCQLDLDKLQTDIANFGEIPELKLHYSTRRPSLSSSISSTLTDPLSPLTPGTPYTPSVLLPPTLVSLPPTPSNLLPVGKPQRGADKKRVEVVAPSQAAPAVHHPLPLGAKVVSQSDSLTKFEISGEMQTMLQNRKDKPTPSTRRSQTPAGRGRSQGRNSQSARSSAGLAAKSQGHIKGEGSRQLAQSHTPGDTTDDSMTSEDKRLSRNARRRLRQRERQKEKKEQQRNEEAASGGDTKDAPSPQSQGQQNRKVNPRPQSPRKEGGMGQQQQRRNFRTPSPTKRNPQMRDGTTKEGQANAAKENHVNASGDAHSTSNFKSAQNGENNKPVAQGNQQQRRSGPRSPMGRGGRGAGRGGQRSRSMDHQQNRGHYQGDRFERQKPDQRTNEVIPEKRAIHNANQEVKASKPTENKDQSGSKNSETDKKTASNTTNIAAETTVATATPIVEKDNNVDDSVKETTVSKEAPSADSNSVKLDNVKNGLTNGVELNNVPDVLSSNNNNNIGSKNKRNVTMTDHYYDREDVENCNVTEDKVNNSMKIQEHIYEEALPQRKPRNRQSRTQTETKIVEMKQEVVTEEVVKQEVVVQQEVTIVKQEVVVNGEVNGKHRWSDEECDQIS